MQNQNDLDQNPQIHLCVFRKRWDQTIPSCRPRNGTPQAAFLEGPTACSSSCWPEHHHSSRAASQQTDATAPQWCSETVPATPLAILCIPIKSYKEKPGTHTKHCVNTALHRQIRCQKLVDNKHGRWYKTIPLSDQWWTTIGKPPFPMVASNHSIQWRWYPWKPSELFAGSKN